MPHSYKNKKGFTLIEILIVIFLSAVLAIMAITSYFNSTKNFNFLNSYKTVMSYFRNARTNAINNEEINGQLPNAYGIAYYDSQLFLFADTGDLKNTFDPPAGTFPSGNPFTSGSDDPAITDKIISSYSFQNTSYRLIFNPLNPLNPPISIFYAVGSADFLLKDSIGIIEKKDMKTLTVKHCENPCGSQNLKKEIFIYQVSGLPEEK